MYFLAMCFPSPRDEADVIERFLKPYWQHFLMVRRQCGLLDKDEMNFDSEEYEIFLLDFKVAVIDFTRYRIKYFINLNTDYSIMRRLPPYSMIYLLRWAFCARLKGDTPEKFQARLEKMDINLGAWRRDVGVIAWLVQSTIKYVSDPQVLAALDAI